MIAHVRKYVPGGSYGFLVPHKGTLTTDIFFHTWVFDALGGPPPIVGEVVELTLSPTDSEKGLPRADHVVRLKLPDQKTGTVLKFDPVKGYGFVSDSQNNTFYLHKSDVTTADVLLPGMVVRFFIGTRTDEGHRPRACYVTLVR